MIYPGSISVWAFHQSIRLHLTLLLHFTMHCRGHNFTKFHSNCLSPQQVPLSPAWNQVTRKAHWCDSITHLPACLPSALSPSFLSMPFCPSPAAPALKKKSDYSSKQVPNLYQHSDLLAYQQNKINPLDCYFIMCITITSTAS